MELNKLKTHLLKQTIETPIHKSNKIITPKNI